MKQRHLQQHGVTSMDLEITIPSRVSQKEKDKYHMWNLNRDMSKLNLKQKQTHRHREQTCDCPVGGVWGEGRIGSLGFADANYYIQNG